MSSEHRRAKNASHQPASGRTVTSNGLQPPRRDHTVTTQPSEQTDSKSRAASVIQSIQRGRATRKSVCDLADARREIVDLLGDRHVAFANANVKNTEDVTQAWDVENPEKSQQKNNMMVLDLVAQVMKRHAGLYLECHGESGKLHPVPVQLAEHFGLSATKDGAEIMNRIAKKRAESCKAALVRRGIAEDKVAVSFSSGVGKMRTTFTPLLGLSPEMMASAADAAAKAKQAKELVEHASERKANDVILGAARAANGAADLNRKRVKSSPAKAGDRTRKLPSPSGSPRNQTSPRQKTTSNWLEPKSPPTSTVNGKVRYVKRNSKTMNWLEDGHSSQMTTQTPPDSPRNSRSSSLSAGSEVAPPPPPRRPAPVAPQVVSTVAPQVVSIMGDLFDEEQSEKEKEESGGHTRYRRRRSRKSDTDVVAVSQPRAAPQSGRDENLEICRATLQKQMLTLTEENEDLQEKLASSRQLAQNNEYRAAELEAAQKQMMTLSEENKDLQKKLASSRQLVQNSEHRATELEEQLFEAIIHDREAKEASDSKDARKVIRSDADAKDVQKLRDELLAARQACTQMALDRDEAKHEVASLRCWRTSAERSERDEACKELAVAREVMETASMEVRELKALQTRKNWGFRERSKPVEAATPSSITALRSEASFAGLSELAQAEVAETVQGWKPELPAPLHRNLGQASRSALREASSERGGSRAGSPQPVVSRASSPSHQRRYLPSDLAQIEGPVLPPPVRRNPPPQSHILSDGRGAARNLEQIAAEATAEATAAFGTEDSAIASAWDSPLHDAAVWLQSWVAHEKQPNRPAQLRSQFPIDVREAAGEVVARPVPVPCGTVYEPQTAGSLRYDITLRGSQYHVCRLGMPT